MSLRLSLPLLGFLAVASSCAAQEQIRPAEGRPQVPWHDARPLVGRAAAVYGKVIDVRRVGRITFINFDQQRPARFTGVIFEEKLGNFPQPPEKMYQGQIVRISGTVSAFKDQPQIVVTKPEQVEVLAAMPEPVVPPAVATRKPKPGELVIGSYNLLNLFDEHDDPYRDDEGTAAKPRPHMERLAASIRALNADVLAVAEVENRDYLERFVNVLLPDMGYRHVVLFEGNDTRGIDVGLLSRIPVGEATSHRHVTFPGADGSPRRFNRDVLAVTLEPTDGPPFEMWVVHLKSNSGGREEAEPIRLAEAVQVRRMLDARLAEDSSARIIVAGDFNDTPESRTIQTIVGAGDGTLWSSAGEFTDSGIVTFNEGEHRSVIDYILATPAMARNYVPDSVQVPQGSIPATGSDHNPIAAAFRLE